MNLAQQLNSRWRLTPPDPPPSTHASSFSGSLRLPSPFFCRLKEENERPFLRETSRLTWELKNLVLLRIRLQRVVRTFLMLAVDLPVIEHRRRRRLSRRNLTQRFLIRFEQRINHRGHLSRNSAEDLFLSPIPSGPPVVGAETREQALIDFCPL